MTISLFQVQRVKLRSHKLWLLDIAPYFVKNHFFKALFQIWFFILCSFFKNVRNFLWVIHPLISIIQSTSIIRYSVHKNHSWHIQIPDGYLRKAIYYIMTFHTGSVHDRFHSVVLGIFIYLLSLCSEIIEKNFKFWKYQAIQFNLKTW